ncbi:glycosyltransferase family 2 protein [Exiguobacterium alkaliphilum]|uniref:glycosyltransferase family 2 protein n=1 Tax=Exiguobacterium alkaliphilum TaxID=1428684 RepID=UPI001BA47614|nr:glycosyltransferase family 2 protein [Exiguobacterium alkaliphilum]QUE87300.1 glycosyltransferase [Exiguobacterium alkaliphilum]
MSGYEEQLAAVQAEKKAWTRKVDEQFQPLRLPTFLEGPTVRGVSVIVASHDSVELLKACLASLERQTLQPSLVEWVLVFNGPNRQALHDASLSYGKDVTVHRLLEEEANVGIARNRGLDAATRQYVTFLDEDDTLSESYLEALFARALPDRIVIADIQDRDPEGKPLTSPLHREFLRLAGQDWAYEQMSQLLTLNACKLVPTVYAKRTAYEPSLKSGEDVVYFSTLFATFTPRVELLAPDTEAIYYRQVREQSVSRQAQSHDFSVRQRMAVIEALNALLDQADESTRRLIERKIDAQTSMMSLYYRDAADERATIRDLVAEAGLSYFSYSVLNQHAASSGVVIGDKLERADALIATYPDTAVIRVYLLNPYTRAKLKEVVTDDQFRRLTFANVSVSNWSLLPEVCYSVGDVRAAALSTEYRLGTNVRAVRPV